MICLGEGVGWGGCGVVVSMAVIDRRFGGEMSAAVVWLVR